MTLVIVSEVVGTLAIFCLFAIQFYIAVEYATFLRAGRAAILWTTVYIFFLFILRLLQLVHIGTMDQLRILSGFSALIPLVAVLAQLVMTRQMNKRRDDER